MSVSQECPMSKGKIQVSLSVASSFMVCLI